MPALFDLILGGRQRSAGRDRELPRHEVETGDLLGDAVLHLETRVHLEEVEVAVLVEHLDGAGADVTARQRDTNAGLVHRGTRRVGDRGRRRFFDELLVPPLGRAVAVADADPCTVRVAEDLQLHVARLGEVALHVALGAPEVGLGLALRALERRLRRRGVLDHLHAATAPAVRGLDRDRVAVLLAEREDLGHVGDRRGGARHRLDVRPAGGEARRDLVAHHLDGLGWRADPRDACRAHRAGEVGVLGEEAVARVHRVGARLLDRGEDRLGVEIALGRGLAAERERLVGEAHVEGVAVELGVDGDGRDPELATGPHHAHRDLATVRDQHLGDRFGHEFVS